MTKTRKDTLVTMSFGNAGSFGDAGLRDDDRESARVAHGDAPATRQSLAMALTARDGVDPFSLVANSLDEEPCDGVLPVAGEAHFAWRDRLGRVPTRD